MRRDYSVSKPNYHITKFFTENLLVIETWKTQQLINKPVYLGLQILELGKTVMYEFQYDYVKPKYGKNAKFCYMDRDMFFCSSKSQRYCRRCWNKIRLQLLSLTDHCLNKNITGWIKDELSG